jgi:trimeric autotransporter adhesin
VRGHAAWHEQARRAPHPPPATPHPPPPADALFDDVDAVDAVKPTPPSCGSPTREVTTAEDGGPTTSTGDDGMGLVGAAGDDTRGMGCGSGTGTALALRSSGASGGDGGDGGEDGGHESGDESDDGGGDEGEGATGTVNDYLPPGTAAHAAPGGAPRADPAATAGLLSADAERLAAHLLAALAAPAGAAVSTAGGGGGGGGDGAAPSASGAAAQGSEDQAATIAADAASTAAALTTSGGAALNTTAALPDALVAHMTAAITTAQSAHEARDRLAHLLHAVVAGLSNDDDKVAFLSRVLVVMRAAAMHHATTLSSTTHPQHKQTARRARNRLTSRVRSTMTTIALHLAKAVLGCSRRAADEALPALLPPLVQRRPALPPSSAASSPAPAHAMARRSAAAAVASPGPRPAAGATTTRGIPAATPSLPGGDVDDGSSGAGGGRAGLLSPLRGAQSTATAATTAAGSRALATDAMEQGGSSSGRGGGAAPLLVIRRAASPPPPASGAAAGGTRAPSASPPTARPPAATPSAGRPRAPASSSVAAPRPRPPAGSGKEAPPRPGAARADRPGGGAAASSPAAHLPRAAKFGGLIGAPNTLGIRGPVRIPPPPSPPLPGVIVQPDGALVVAPAAAVWSCERHAEWLAATEEAELASGLSAAAIAATRPPAPAPSAAGAARGGAGAAVGGAGGGAGAPDYWAVEGRLTSPDDYEPGFHFISDSKQARPPFLSYLGQRVHDGAGDVIQLRDVADVLVSGRGGGAGEG